MRLRYGCKNTKNKDSGKVKTKKGNTVIRAAALGVALAVAPGLMGCDKKPAKDETAQLDKKTEDKKQDKAKECTAPDCFDDGYGDVEWKSSYGATEEKLERALYDEDIEKIKEFADKMDDINAPIGYRSNAIETASRISDVEVVGALLDRGAKVTRKSLWNASRIEADWVEGRVVDDGVFELLLNNGGKEIIQSDKKFGEMLLIETARYREYVAVRLLAEAGVDVNAANKKGETALYFAMLYNKNNRNGKIIELLKSKGANEVIPHDKEVINNDLVEAISSGSTYMLKKLVDAGADVNRVLSNEYNVIEDACQYGNSEMVSYLLDNGAVLTEYALETAAVLSDNNKPDSMKKFEVVMEKGGEEIIMNGGGAGALADAATGGDIEAVNMMLKAGASIEAIKSARWAVVETLNYIEFEAEYEEGKDCCIEWKKDLKKRLEILEKAAARNKAVEKECLSETEKSNTRGIDKAVVDSILSGKTPSPEIKEALDSAVTIEENLRKLEEFSECIEQKKKQ